MHFARLAVLGLTIGTLAAACCFTGCGGSGAAPAADTKSAAAPSADNSASVAITPTAATKPARPKPVDPIVIVHTSLGDIQVQLFAEKAPVTVDNFLRNYVERGFYAGTIFHHVDAGSIIIAGGYSANLAPKETRTGIFSEANNGLANKRSTIAMIRDPSDPRSATSQFFINVVDNPALDYQSDESPEAWGYCVFGQVIAGMDIVDKIAHSAASAQGDFALAPTTPIVIQSIEQIR